MKTKNIFKTLVLAAVLVSACGKNEIADDFKGYALPVTVNVTRQGDEPATRASYNESTRKLSFSAGDKLFVIGYHDDPGSFAGTLEYDAVSGKFSGTLTTQKEYTGTIDDLMASAYAFLLPDGYGSYGFFSIEGSGSEATITYDDTKAFALTKAAAVEQFSFEQAFEYNNGFALKPANAIVSFTINGLTANKEVAVSFDISLGTISGNVTTSAEGVATFAVGVYAGINLGSCTLTVDGINIAMPSKQTETGHIYNISRSVAPAGPTAYTLAESTVGMIVGTDGKAYAAADKDNLPLGVTAVAMVAYKSATAGESLAIQLNSSPEKMNWAQAKTYVEGLTAVSGGTWRLPSKDDWQNMFVGCAVSGDATVPDAYNQMNPIAGFKAKIAATGITWQSSNNYWASTESGSTAWLVGVHLGDSSALAAFMDFPTSMPMSLYVRACLAF